MYMLVNISNIIVKLILLSLKKVIFYTINMADRLVLNVKTQI